MSVHFPAAYLQEMKRVVFIGGGDAMLLHETLKYPSVELVLGLELDQKVVRESLKHFRTQPHFEDPRVQWWFGDAAKSLTLLPKEWFGTFDLVMVDLSETAMSISVTDDLDIFGALSLLMKPDGIFVKNELYYGQMSNLFDYSAFVYMVDYPILCDQDWAMGSNHHDFLRANIDGGHMEQQQVKTFEYTPLEDEDDHYKLIKDYSHNDARAQGKCDDYDKEQKDGPAPPKDLAKPERSAGILLVVEADGVDDARKVTKLEDTVADLLAAEGLHPLAPGAVTHHAGAEPVQPEGSVWALFVAMEEGYLALHHYPTRDHVGFEIALWSKINAHDSLRARLLDALGASDRFSSYRVVHGGMLGAKNWQEDVAAVGPVKRNLRQCDPAEKAKEPQAGDGPMPVDVFAVAVTAGLALLPKKMDKVVAVLCGVLGQDGCAVAEALRDAPAVDKVVALWACPADGKKEKFGDDDDDKVSHVQVCAAKDLKRSAKIEEGYSAVVVDPAASSTFVADMSNEFCKRKDMGQHVLMRDQVALMMSLAEESHTVFFASCVKGLVKHMVRSARMIVDKTAQFGIIGTNSPGFVRRAVTVKDTIQKKTGRATSIEKMVGGPVQQQREYDPEHFPPNAYDERDAFRQYTNQVPLASQSLYAIEVANAADVAQLSAATVTAALDAVVAANRPRLAVAARAEYAAEIGDGCVAAAVLAAAHVIVTWDGAARLTLNILTVGEQYEPVPPDAEVPDMALTGHKDEIVDVFLSKLPPSAGVAVREQMPRGANRVVNFKTDISAVPNCTDHFDLCMDFAKEGECDEEEEMVWMQQYCSLSCGTCDKMNMGGPQGPA